MFTDFVCFQFYFRDYVAQPYSQIGTAYICSSIKVLSRNAQRRIFVDCAGVRFIILVLYCSFFSPFGSPHEHRFAKIIILNIHNILMLESCLVLKLN